MRCLAILVVLTGGSLLRAADEVPVRLEALNRDPGRYEGKTVVVWALASGTLFDGPAWYRLTLKGETGLVVSDKLRADGITFMFAKGDRERLTAGWKADGFTPVRLTAAVDRGERKGYWRAIVSAAEASDRPPPPTARQVADDPQDFVGQSLTFDRVQVAADWHRLPGRYGLAVKADGVEFKPAPAGPQKLRFVTPDQGEAVRAALAGQCPGDGDKTRLTCRIEQPAPGEYVATVRRLDAIRFEDETAAPPGTGVAEVAVEDVVKDPGRYLARWVVFDGVRLTKEAKPGPSRMQIGVRSAAGVEFNPPGPGQRPPLWFSLAGAKRGEQYRDTRHDEDVGRPVRLVCEITKPGLSHIAVIRRIDRVTDLAPEKSPEPVAVGAGGNRPASPEQRPEGKGEPGGEAPANDSGLLALVRRAKEHWQAIAFVFTAAAGVTTAVLRMFLKRKDAAEKAT